MSRWTDDPGGGGGQWGAKWGGMMWCGSGAEGRAGIGVRAVLEDGGRLGVVKKIAHKNTNGV